MYELFYRLNSDPFRLLPDANVCFLHRSCARAWAYLRYALERGEGIVVVTGAPGSGKTTLAGRLMRELNSAATVGVRIVADDPDPNELLRKLAYAFGLPAEGMDHAQLVHAIERHLVELRRTQRLALVVVDEAQSLSAQAIDALRLLADQQADSQPLLQLFLLGQTELEEMLRAPEMEHFQQRVIASCRLYEMDLDETRAYIEYRLLAADWLGDPVIDGAAVMAIFRYSGGMPRHVNKICGRLLLHGSAEDRHVFSAADVQVVVNDLRDELLAPREASSADHALPDPAGAALEALAIRSRPVPPARPDRALLAAMDELSLEDIVQRGASGKPGSTPRGQDGDQAWGARPQTHPMRRPIGAGWDALRRSAGAAASRVRRAFEPIDAGIRARISVPLRLPIGTGTRYLFARGRKMVRWPGAVTAGVAAAAAVLIALALRPPPAAPPDTVAASDPLRDRRGIVLADADRPSALPGPQVYLSVPAENDPAADGLREAEPRVAPDGQASAPAGDSGDALSPLAATGWTASADVTGDLLARVLVGMDDDLLAIVQREPVIEEVLFEAPHIGQRQRMPLPAASSHQSRLNQVPEPAPLDTRSASSTDRIRQAAGEPALLDPDLAQAIPPPAAEPVAAQDAGATVPFAEAAGSGHPHGAPPAQLSGRPAALGSSVAQDIAGDDGTTVGDERAAQMVRLLELGAQALREDRLTVPAATSAYRYYTRVLAMNADAAEAQAGISHIVRRYRQLAAAALRDQAFDRTARYIDRGLSVQGNDAGLLGLRQRLGEAIARAEADELAAAELARMAASQGTPSKPAIEPEPEPEINFRILMRAVD